MLSKVQRYVHCGGALVRTEALGSLLDGTHAGFPHERQNKQYLIPLDVHWTHSKVVAYGLGEDALHNPENAMMFLNGMQISTGNVDGVDVDEVHAISGRTLSEIACIRRASGSKQHQLKCGTREQHFFKKVGR